MAIPSVISQRLSQLGAECGTELQVVSHWANEFRPGWYCRFRGVAVRSDLLIIELAGTLAVELGADRSDDVDMFIFVNGTRVSAWNPKSAFKYLWRTGSDSLRWDYLDDGCGYDQFETLDNEAWRPNHPGSDAPNRQ